MKSSAQELRSLAVEPPPAKCIACGHSNSAGEASCQACGSSLDLKLCSSCEAINAIKAEHCHACGARFASPVDRTMPVAMAYTIDAPRRRGRRVVALLGVLVLAVFLAYRYYGGSLAPALQAVLAAVSTEARPPAAQGAIEPAKEEAPKAMPAEEAPKPTVAKESVKATPVKEAAKATPAKEATPVKDAPKATAAARPADARPAPRAHRAVVPAHAQASGSTALLRGEEAAKPAAPIAGVSESSPRLSMRHPRVTHTKPMPNAASLPVASAVVPQTTGSNGCSQAAVALGLCARNEKDGGK